MTVERRGTSNTNDRGSAEARRARKNWLLDVFGADVDVVTIPELQDLDVAFALDGLTVFETFHIDKASDDSWSLPKGLGRPACRCFRCGKLVTYETMEVDRIVPGCSGGTYARTNIRPVCPDCNKKIAAEDKKRRNARRKKRNEQARERRARQKATTDRIVASVDEKLFDELMETYGL